MTARGATSGMRLTALLLAAAGVTLIGLPSAADAQYRRAVPRTFELPPTEARGCYFYRGREYCGSYCYWEVNGKRYCQQRERNAHSQAPLAVEDFYDGDYVLK